MKKSILALAVLSIPATSMALPSLREDCSFGSTVNTGGADVMFSQNCKTAYVAPPDLGTASLGGYVETQGISFCSNLDYAKSEFDSSQTRSKVWREKAFQLQLDGEPLVDAKIQSNVELTALKAQIDYWQYGVFKQSYEMALLEYTNRFSAYSGCLRGGAMSAQECLDARYATEDAYYEAKRIYDDYRSANNISLYKIDRLVAEIDGLEEQIFEIDERVMRYETYADNIEQRAKENYIELATMYGANTKIIYQLDYDAHVESIRRLNTNIPQLTSWRPMPLVAAEFVLNMSPAYASTGDSALNNITPIHSVTLPRQLISYKPKGFDNLYENYNGEEKSTEEGAYMNNINPNDVDALVYGSFGSSSASIATNLHGACKLKNDGVTESELAAKMDTYIQPSLRLQWLIEVPFGYEAKYKAHSIISRMTSNKSSGFLFWKKRKSSFHEWTKNTQDFEVNFINPPFSEYWDEDMKATVKEAIMRRIAFGVMDSVYPRITAAPLNDAEHQAWSDAAKQVGCSFGPWGCAIGWVVGTLDNRRNYSRFYSDKSRFYTERSNEITYIPKDKYLTFKAN
ncbi:hypothetical protein J8M20_16000 [Pseudoalteromonas luteoviolacea]|uniref:hypothetical protein n=1 Tax=Pseudoalteromonas luteoviolacea TaxID=43657 RepID=UPI000813B8A0|nr:hypothetical protein [Pseudoalteromonas luteoviolacea]MBQ4812863.1 hypothetical protein [Pseudoalteromonas luteoviolacea]